MWSLRIIPEYRKRLYQKFHCLQNFLPLNNNETFAKSIRKTRRVFVFCLCFIFAKTFNERA